MVVGTSEVGTLLTEWLIISKAVTTPNPELWRLRNMQGKSPNLVEFTLEDQLQKERIKRALNEYWEVKDLDSLHEMSHMLLEMFYMQKGMTGFMVKEAADNLLR